VISFIDRLQKTASEIDEAELIPMSRSLRLSSYAGKKVDPMSLRGMKMISRTDTGHVVYMRERPGVKGKRFDVMAYDPTTKKVDAHFNGYVKHHRNGFQTLDIDRLQTHRASRIKAHELYQHMIDRHSSILVGRRHSEGGQKVWQRLADQHNVNIHGWSAKNKPVSIDPRDPTDTHVTHAQGVRYPEDRSTMKMALVAHRRK
jgi:hypothetical protein